MMSSSLESRQPTSWLWPESSTLLPAALLCTRILPSLFNNRKVESLPFPCVSQSAQVWPTPHNKKHYHDMLPSTTDQVRVCQGKVTHIPLVTWVDLRWVTVEFPRILAQFVRLNVSGLRQKEKLSIQLQPRQESGGKRQKTQRWEFKLKHKVKPASLMRDETCSALSSWNFFKPSTKIIKWHICEIWFSFSVSVLLFYSMSCFKLQHCINPLQCTYFTFHLRGVALLQTPSDQFWAVFTLFLSGMWPYLQWKHWIQWKCWRVCFVFFYILFSLRWNPTRMTSVIPIATMETRVKTIYRNELDCNKQNKTKTHLIWRNWSLHFRASGTFSPSSFLLSLVHSIENILQLQDIIFVSIDSTACAPSDGFPAFIQTSIF